MKIEFTIAELKEIITFYLNTVAFKTPPNRQVTAVKLNKGTTDSVEVLLSNESPDTEK